MNSSSDDLIRRKSYKAHMDMNNDQKGFNNIKNANKKRLIKENQNNIPSLTIDDFTFSSDLSSSNISYDKKNSSRRKKGNSLESNLSQNDKFKNKSDQFNNTNKFLYATPTNKPKKPIQSNTSNTLPPNKKTKSSKITNEKNLYSLSKKSTSPKDLFDIQDSNSLNENNSFEKNKLSTSNCSIIYESKSSKQLKDIKTDHNQNFANNSDSDSSYNSDDQNINIKFVGASGEDDGSSEFIKSRIMRTFKKLENLLNDNEP